MENNNIYWKDAIELIKSGKSVAQTDINFANEKIPVNLAGFLNQHNIRVDERNVLYDDSLIDCSDIPEITEDDINEGRIQWIDNMEFKIDNEIRTWLIQQNIKLSELIPFLIKGFYQSVKFAKKNAAL